MTKWKLTREWFGSEEYVFKEGDEVTIGRSMDNVIPITSLVISRKHCIISFFSNKAVIKDSGSSNGVYVGSTKIPPNKDWDLNNSDIIGIGWFWEVPMIGKLADSEKFVFKLTREDVTPVINRIQFQPSENELDNIEEELAKLDSDKEPEKLLSPILSTKLSLKRKIDPMKCENIKTEIKKEKLCNIITEDDDVILLSDNDLDISNKSGISGNEKIKQEPLSEENQSKNQANCENKYLEFEAFHVKQEYLGYDEEPINIDSDSDDESKQWLLRLSQNSPGKPFTKMVKTKVEEKVDDSTSYSQMDDDFIIDLSGTDNDEEFMEDIIIIPPPTEKVREPEKHVTNTEEFVQELRMVNLPNTLLQTTTKQTPGLDEIDNQIPVPEKAKNLTPNETKKAQMIDALFNSPKQKCKHNSESQSHKGAKHKKDNRHSSKKHISHSHKEERKKKLKELAIKEKNSNNKSDNAPTSTSCKPTVNVKVTNSSRGAFLANTNVEVVNTENMNSEQKESNSKTKFTTSSDEIEHGKQTLEDTENKKHKSSKSKSTSRSNEHKSSHERKEHKSSNSRKEHNSSKIKELEKQDSSKTKSSNKVEEPLLPRIPLKSLKPLPENDKASCKPILVAKIGPMPAKESKKNQIPTEKIKKKVRFSDTPPDIFEFEILPGNKMKKTSSVKQSLVDIRRIPLIRSLSAMALTQILRWNPSWLEEQLNNASPPPILGHNNPPTALLHSFANHQQYVQVVGNLLYMEIWECLSVAYIKSRDQNSQLEMRIGCLPPPPNQDRVLDLFSLSVDMSLPSHEAKRVPRNGEILIIRFGTEPHKAHRFFYVNNVKCLPSPSNNIHTFYNVTLQTIYASNMVSLKPGEVVFGQSLAYIGNELNLFEAMEYLESHPLCDAILRPEPRHFEPNIPPPNSLSSKWTSNFNPSQLSAVSSTVAAALGNKPCIQMVQGPPGTGKSSVICAMVMTYFYNDMERRRPNRGKILICATSNAAVDELVIRLINIRQELPKAERFRMVRVGREEAMAPRARNVCSQVLAQRDAAARMAEPAPHHAEEIAYLEAKINMYKSQAQESKDPMRVAFCQSRIAELGRKVALHGATGGRELRHDEMLATERRIIEGADIVVTTLASACNYKMKSLRGRVALCIIDEAGQAIEPETLLPLQLDVTCLTLIGDPQQLPGFICSQRAKVHGLGESLFARLASSCELWARSPVALLACQYRMHADIADYPNRAFYAGRVRTAPPARPAPAPPLPPYSLLAIASGDKAQGTCGGNETEACGVARVASALAAALRPRGLSLAVISPYHAHKDLIKKYIRMLHGPHGEAVEVNTVDSFQGQERDVVVVSLARSHGAGFLTDAGRMNVMLTRARHALLVCLNPHALLKNDLWRTLIEDAQKRKMYRTLPSHLCSPISPGENGYKDILKYVNK